MGTFKTVVTKRLDNIGRRLKNSRMPSNLLSLLFAVCFCCLLGGCGSIPVPGGGGKTVADYKAEKAARISGSLERYNKQLRESKPKLANMIRDKEIALKEIRKNYELERNALENFKTDLTSGKINIGPRPKDNEILELAEKILRPTLKDPDSGRFRVTMVYQGWTYPESEMKLPEIDPNDIEAIKRRASSFDEEKIWYAQPAKDADLYWVAVLAVNAKNSFGGFTGEKPMYVRYRNGKPVFTGVPRFWDFLLSSPSGSVSEIHVDQLTPEYIKSHTGEAQIQARLKRVTRMWDRDIESEEDKIRSYEKYRSDAEAQLERLR